MELPGAGGIRRGGHWPPAWKGEFRVKRLELRWSYPGQTAPLREKRREPSLGQINLNSTLFILLTLPDTAGTQTPRP